MNIDKKIIKTDWLNYIKSLKEYGQNKFYRLSGPVILGIELIKLPRSQEYRPHFVVYPLWKEGVSECLERPIILLDYSNKKGMEFSIPYARHTIHFEDVKIAVKAQTPVLFENHITQDNLFDLVRNYSQAAPLGLAQGSYLQAQLMESKFCIALYYGFEQAEEVLTQIREKNWDEHHFKAWNASVNSWLESIRSQIGNRELFLERINLNTRDNELKKIANL